MSLIDAASLPSTMARRRMLSVRGEPLFHASWDRAVFIHYEADPAALQRCVPFPLDLYEGRAFVSLVAFTLRRMRPRRGGRLGEWLLKPIANHEFLNVRTYVRGSHESGIFFLAEWLANALSVPLGPPIFGLPYRYGRIRYEHADPAPGISGRVEARQGCLAYHCAPCATAALQSCEPGSLPEFLLERYTAFTRTWMGQRLFRVWHQPWPHTELDITITADSLLAQTGPWWRTACRIGAHYSPGVEVWMGRPHFVD